MKFRHDLPKDARGLGPAPSSPAERSRALTRKTDAPETRGSAVGVVAPANELAVPGNASQSVREARAVQRYSIVSSSPASYMGAPLGHALNFRKKSLIFALVSAQRAEETWPPLRWTLLEMLGVGGPSLKSFGGPESFELCEVPKPLPHAGQVLVRVHATSINPLDFQVRRGDYADLVPLPTITGHDVSGVVEAVGSGVTRFVPGDEVWYTPQIFGGPGSYAEYHAAPEGILGKKPPALSHLEAASLTLVGGTAWEALVVRASLRVGESILVHGGAGGVGMHCPEAPTRSPSSAVSSRL